MDFIGFAIGLSVIILAMGSLSSENKVQTLINKEIVKELKSLNERVEKIEKEISKWNQEN